MMWMDYRPDLLIRLSVEQVKASSANQLQNWTQDPRAPTHTLNPVWLRPGQPSASTQSQGTIITFIQLRRWTHLGGTTIDILPNEKTASLGPESHITFSGTQVAPMCVIKVHGGRYFAFCFRGHWLAGQSFNIEKTLVNHSTLRRLVVLHEQNDQVVMHHS